MRFIFYDHILEMAPGKQIAATRAISIGDEFLPAHFSRKPLMPATLVLESVTQVAGWLYIVTQNFGISTVLALAQGVEVCGEVCAGSTLRLEASMTYAHTDGATLRGSATCDGKLILQVERLVFASRPLAIPEDIQRSREFFYYISGGYQLNGTGRP